MNEKDAYIIEQYQKDESMMIMIFAQWCLNNNLDASELYQRAYPNQPINKELLRIMDETVAKEESEDISTDVVQHVLQLFGNDDLAFTIQDVIDTKSNKKD